MNWLLFPLLIIGVAALGYKIFCQVQVEIIEKKKPSSLFWISLGFMCFIPVFHDLKNTSAAILAIRANAVLCIFYSCVIIVFLLDIV